MTPQAAILMADYNRWMNHRLYDSARTLSDAALAQDRGAFFGSILATLNHIAVGDTIWLHRFSQVAGPLADGGSLLRALSPFPRPGSLTHTLAPDLDGLRRYRDGLDAVIATWCATLDDAYLAQPLRYQSMAGHPFSKPLGLVLLHFFNHQTHHRGQVTTLLHQAGVDMGVTDLLVRMPDTDT